MDWKSEGAALPPFPLALGTLRPAVSPSTRLLFEGPEPRCEMCGAPVLAAHCRLICLKCGFLASCEAGH